MMQTNDFIKVRAEDFEQSQDEMFEDWMFQRASADRMEQAIYEATDQLDFLTRAIDADAADRQLVLDETQTAGFLRIMENISRNLMDATGGVEKDNVKAAIDNFKKQEPEQPDA